MWYCKHCGKGFDFEKPNQMANHSRWCELNPKRKEYAKKLSYARDCISEEGKKQNQFTTGKVKAHSLETKAKIGKASKGRKHSDTTKELMREKALASNHRRLRKSTSVYVKADGTKVLLDSSWEVKVAAILDEMEIKWERPDPLYYELNGIRHRYYPDFYLIDYNLYLDPKNDFAIKNQQDKINVLLETYSNIVIMRGKDLNIDFIKSLIQRSVSSTG